MCLHIGKVQLFFTEWLTENGSDKILTVILGVYGQLGIILFLNKLDLILHGLGLQLNLFPGLIKLLLDNMLNIINLLKQEQRLFHQLRIRRRAYLKDQFVQIPVAGPAIELTDLVVNDLVGELALGLFEQLGDAHVDLQVNVERVDLHWEDFAGHEVAGLQFLLVVFMVYVGALLALKNFLQPLNRVQQLVLVIPQRTLDGQLN